MIGFDLDMTLVDARPGITAGLHHLALVMGRELDVPSVLARLGPPLERSLEPWFTPAELPRALDVYRSFMRDEGARDVLAMPGARESLSAAGRTLVLTAKDEAQARVTLHAAGLTADVLEGDRWSDGKAEALRRHGATVYVGDRRADMAAARAGGAVGVGVTTGGTSAARLLAAGAAVVLTSLTEFPAWLAEHRAGRPAR